MVNEKSKSRKVEESKPPVRISDGREGAVWRALQSVSDPEIPVVSVLDMGMIAGVRFTEGAGVEVDLMPTFAGCPALDVIRGDITKAINAAGEPSVCVRTVFDPPWTSDRITDEGRRKLKQFGFAPPQRGAAGVSPRRTDYYGSDVVPLTVSGVPTRSAESTADPSVCPFCDSQNTQMESMFGPTLCRAIHYCHDCLQSFEQFKVV